MLKVVYQDCPTCGNRKNWGEKTIRVAKESGLEIEFISFASPDGANLCKQAIYAGIGRLPFITDGTRFSDNIEDFVKAQEAPKKRRARKTKKEEQSDGTV